MDDGAVDCRILEQILSHGFEISPCAVFVTITVIGKLYDARLADVFHEEIEYIFDVVGMNQIKYFSADQFFRLVTERRLNRGTFVADGSVGIDDGDDVVRVLDKGTKMLFAAPQRLFRPLKPGVLFF